MLLENLKETYIKELINNQNTNAFQEQQNLYHKESYQKLLNPVTELLLKHKDWSLKEFRDQLFNQSHISERLKAFIYEKEMVPGMVFTYGTDKYHETVVIGNKQEVTLNNKGELIPSIEQMTDDTIFDLASVTKIFTSFMTLKLIQNNILDINDKVTKYVPKFINLNDVTIYDILSFTVPFITEGRVDNASTKEEAEKILYTMKPNRDFKGVKLYSDMGAMVLKYVIESITGQSYYQLLDQSILKPLGLTETYVKVPNYKLDRVASTNFEGKLNNKYNFITDVEKGIINDPKARLLSNNGKELSGHAGLFSTTSDMTKLARGVMGGLVIDDHYIAEMAKNRTGKKLEDGSYSQYLGFLCYSKHPVLSDSEIFHALSGKTSAIGGWTGTQLTIDPINKLFFFLGGNRTHNRMTYIDDNHSNDIMTNEKGKQTIVLPNGETRIVTKNYAWDRDPAVVHPTIELAIQYKFLEYLFSYEKDQSLEEEIIRNIK